MPIGARGERKRAGARITDKGTFDFDWAEVTVRNSDGIGKAINFEPFVVVNARSVAEPSTSYAAATGTSPSLGEAFDYGFFQALFEMSPDASGPYGEVKITYGLSGITNVIAGTTIPARNSSATWRAQVTGGTPPYSYYWYRDGALVGTSEYYTGSTGTTNFGLRAAVVDQTMSERAAVMPVDVGGALVSISGPETAYLDNANPLQRNATFTAQVQGGTAPFTYRWYRDGHLTGTTTASHTEHIDERVDFTVRVHIEDSTGKTAVEQKWVRVAERTCDANGCVIH